MRSVVDRDDVVLLALDTVYLVLRDYKPAPILAASRFRFAKTDKALAPDETVFRKGVLQLAYIKNESGRMETDQTMGVFLDDIPIYAVKLNQQHDWEMVSIARATFQPFCDTECLLLKLRSSDNDPLTKQLGVVPDELLLFLLGSSILDDHYPIRVNFVTPHNLYIAPGDPVLLDPKSSETPFTVMKVIHESGAVEHIVRTDRHLFTVLIQGDKYIVGGGKWTNDHPRYSYVPVLAQLYRIVSRSCFIPFFLEDGVFENIVSEEDYLKIRDDYIT